MVRTPATRFSTGTHGDVGGATGAVTGALVTAALVTAASRVCVTGAALVKAVGLITAVAGTRGCDPLGAEGVSLAVGTAVAAARASTGCTAVAVSTLAR
ncbi:hypothetical protein B5P44_28160 [Mycobacterium sp. CBMA 213]|nr:hypothetical protein [Mycolicibacterium sp. CBMA 213]